MCAMLPRRVGGPELSLKRLDNPLSLAPLHDQLLRFSVPFPFVYEGGVAGRDMLCPCVAPESEYMLKLSRIRWSSLTMCAAVLLGDDGYCDDDWPDA